MTEKQKDGKPWKNERMFKTYDEAFTAKVEFDHSNKQFVDSKIKKKLSGFVLKTRFKKEILEEQERALAQNQNKETRNKKKHK